MRYMLMRKADAATEAGDPPDEGVLAAMADYNRRLAEAGVFVSGEGLRPSREGCRIERRNGEVLVTDGPFAETKEQLAGFYLLEARDLNEALRLAGRIPPARFGTIEVRPVRQLPPRDPAPEASSSRPSAGGESP